MGQQSAGSSSGAAVALIVEAGGETVYLMEGRFGRGNLARHGGHELTLGIGKMVHDIHVTVKNLSQSNWYRHLNSELGRTMPIIRI